MSKIKTTPKEIFSEYQQGNNYKASVGALGIFEQTKINERFFIGDQWYGAQCGNSRPLVRNNVIKRIGEYKMSSIGAAPVTVNYSAEGVPSTQDMKKSVKETQALMINGEYQMPNQPDNIEISVITDALSSYQKTTAERLKFDLKNEQLLRNAYVSGTGIAYTYWDNEIETGNIKLKNMESGEEQELNLATFESDILNITISESLKEFDNLDFSSVMGNFEI